jgi:hypothetical protein
MRDEPKTFLTIKETLREREFRGLSVRGFTRAVANGQLQVYRFDKWRRLHRDDVRRWIDQHRASARGR